LPTARNITWITASSFQMDGNDLKTFSLTSTTLLQAKTYCAGMNNCKCISQSDKTYYLKSSCVITGLNSLYTNYFQHGNITLFGYDFANNDIAVKQVSLSNYAQDCRAFCESKSGCLGGVIEKNSVDEGIQPRCWAKNKLIANNAAQRILYI
jgi:hypothetical protein